MKKILLLLSAALLMPLAGAAASSAHDSQNVTSSSFHVTDPQALEIGQRIWQNQSGGTADGIVAWGASGNGEYAEIGINQSLWFSEKYLEDPTTTKFVEDWPVMARYLKKHGFDIPDWSLEHCPWETKEQFLTSLNDQKVIELRDLLTTDEAVTAQTRCIIKRLKKALPKMLEGLSEEDAAKVTTSFTRIASTPNGMYALIDYVNFKGEGTSPNERFNGEGWGLLQVLETMSGATDDSLQEFYDAADTMLKRLISNHPSAERCLPGWEARLQTYLTF